MHVYQGLDVVIFSVLKCHWSEAHDNYERMRGHRVTKSNFLALYAQAHMKVLTKENIISAFKKTGVVPYNPDIVMVETMAPSLATSMHNSLPVDLSSPVRAVSTMVMDYKKQSQSEIDNKTIRMTQLFTPTWQGLQDLVASSSRSFLLSSSPLTSAISPSMYSTLPISPMKHCYTELLNIEPETEHKEAL